MIHTLQNTVVKWNELKDAADRILSIFLSGEETKFAHKAWNYIIKAGLAEYSSPDEDVIVKMRFIALVDVYLDYCRIAHEEDHDSEYYDWIDHLDLEADRIPPVYESLFPNSEADKDLDVSDKIRVLSDYFRKEIVNCLIKGFGSESILFLAFWKSTHTRNKEKDSEILNSLSLDKLQVYEWIDNGCDYKF